MKVLNENNVLFPPHIHIRVASIMCLNAPKVPLFEKKLVRESHFPITERSQKVQDVSMGMEE